MATQRPHVVVIGSGFGGLFCTQALKEADVDITLVAGTVSHLFQPLLYQVATGILSPGEIAPSTREILKHQKNVSVLLSEVTDIDVERRTITAEALQHTTTLTYDHLVVAAGAGQSYFGNDHFTTFAPGMKTIDDALELRARIFGAFEVAELTTDPAERERLMTFVVVGAGPTGVEMAGQIRELAERTLAGEFRTIDSRDARVILVDGVDKVLPAFGGRLSKAARRKLEQLGIEVRLNAFVTDIDGDSVTLQPKGGPKETIPAGVKVWAAGVQASPLGRRLAEQTGADVDKAGRVAVNPDLTLPGHDEVFVVGDMIDLDGLPGVAQVAIQTGQYAAAKIREKVGGEGTEKAPERFSYFDRGSMAVISRFGAIAKIDTLGLRLTGFPAWIAWLGVHLMYLVGFKNRLTTLIAWAIAFVGRGRSERTTTRQQLTGRLALKQLGPDFQPTITGTTDASKIDPNYTVR